VAAFEILLRRFCERAVVGSEEQAMEVFRGLDGPPLPKAWRAWVRAERALHERRPQSALAWLAAAQEASEGHLDVPLAAELASSETRAWLWLDEPRDALDPAHRAWRAWLELGRGPSIEAVAPSIRALLAVLSEPDPPPQTPDDELYRAWLLDRFTRQFDSASRRLLGVYADLGQVRAAEDVARDFLDWVDQHVTRTFGELSGAVVAGFQLALGDVFDRCGDPERALAAFGEGLHRLEGLPEMDETVWNRAQLRFNAGNQLGHLGRYEEALVAFETAERDMAARAEGEPVLRARFGVLITRFKLGREEGLIDELGELAAAYEGVLAGAASGAEQLGARQGLDRVYRLWMRLSAARLDTSDARATLMFFHQLFALKEEEGKLTRLRRMSAERPTAELHTEISVMIDRLDQRADATLLIVEQGAGALVIVAMRPGAGPWHARVSVQVVEEAEPFTDLIRAQRDTIDRMAARELPAEVEPAPAFVKVCGRAWRLLDPAIRSAIDAVDTLVVTLDNQTQLDELPIELLHDGTTYLGLRKDVLRVPSLADLNVLLGENRTNAAPTGSAVVVRSDDDLAQANAESEAVERRLGELGIAAVVRGAPDGHELLQTLGAGVDVLHYVGHGLADEIGEELPLGPGKRLTALQIGAIRPAPAPVAILGACLAARGRQLRTGRQQGFVPALLRRGSPAVVGAKYLVGDYLAAEYAALLYFFLERQGLPAAVRATRLALADEGYHPAAWSLFVLYGRPGVRIQRPHGGTPTTWPSAALRYLATGAESHLALTLRLLAADERLDAASRAAVERDLAALAAGDGAYFHDGITAETRGLGAFSEAMMASILVRAFGVLRFGVGSDPTERERVVHALIRQALSMEQILADTYLLVATAVEMREHTLLYLHGEGKNDMLRARRRLRWLSADADALAHVRSALEQ
jgi:tetratricopeptide (TPR) repeat protein